MLVATWNILVETEGLSFNQTIGVNHACQANNPARLHCLMLLVEVIAFLPASLHQFWLLQVYQSVKVVRVCQRTVNRGRVVLVVDSHPLVYHRVVKPVEGASILKPQRFLFSWAQRPLALIPQLTSYHQSARPW